MSDAFSAIKAQEEALLCRSYSRYPVAVVRGKGSRLWDVDGKEYVDLLAGIAVTALGHCNDEVCAALEAQAHKLWHVSNLFYQEEQLELARLLLGTSHHGKVFFLQFRRRGQRGLHQAGPPLHAQGQAARRLRDHHPGRLLPRPYLRRPGRHGPREPERRLHAAARRLQAGARQ